jgi:hypothetical protein
MERDILDDPVALVEDSKHRHPLRHWSDASLAIGGRGGLPSRGQRGIRLVRALPTRCKHECGEQ